MQIGATHSDVLGCSVLSPGYLFFFRSAGGYCFLGFIELNKTKMKGSFSLLCRLSLLRFLFFFFLLFLENKYAKEDLMLFLLETFGSVVFTTFLSFWLSLPLYVSPDVAFCFSFALRW